MISTQKEAVSETRSVKTPRGRASDMERIRLGVDERSERDDDSGTSFSIGPRSSAEGRVSPSDTASTFERSSAVSRLSWSIDHSFTRESGGDAEVQGYLRVPDTTPKHASPGGNERRNVLRRKSPASRVRDFVNHRDSAGNHSISRRGIATAPEPQELSPGSLLRYFLPK